MRVRRRHGARRVLAAAAALALTLGLLSGCQVETKPAETRIFAMDTTMSMTIYGKNAKESMNDAVDEIYRLDTELDVGDPSSAVFALNDGSGDWVDIGEEAAKLLHDSLGLCRLTNGALDISAYSAVRAWGFTTGSFRVPDQAELDELKSKIDYTKIEVDEEHNRARMDKGMALDTGSVAKGYTGDLLSRQLKQEGIKSALLDLGQSSIQAIGSKPNGSPWRIGIRDPQSEDYIGVLELDDMAMGTSGGYQRFFTQDGQTYWHIMDPETAAPAQSNLGSVTVVSPSGLLCDGLSTAMFVMGEAKGAQLWRDHRDLNFELIFIRDDGSVAITEGLEKSFSLAKDYKDREVTVLR